MPHPAIIFELPPTIKLDGPTIDFLIKCVRDAVAYDAEVAVVAASPEHQLLLELTRLASVLPAFRSVEEATAFIDKSVNPTPADKLA